MDWETYQKRVSETAIYPDAGSGNIQALMYCAGSATGEAGEVWGQVKKAYRDDGGVVTDERKAKIEKEIGDTLWYLAQLCNELDVSGGKIMLMNLKKLSLRAETGTLGGDGDDRELIGPEHALEITEGGQWLLEHLGCGFDRLVCPFTLAAQISKQDPADGCALFPPGVYSAALDERGELELVQESGSVDRRWSEYVHEVRAPRRGWDLTFVPAKGLYQGEIIKRTFWYEDVNEARRVCRRAYGPGTEIKYGERTDGKDYTGSMF